MSFPRMRSAFWGLLLILPALTLVALLIVFPVAYNLTLGFYSKHAFIPGQTFIFLENYISLFGSDPHFWSSLRNGVIFAFGTVFFQLLLGVGAALLLDEPFPGRGLIRGTLIFPYVLPTVVGVIIWRWILNDQYGILNFWLRETGLGRGDMSWIAPNTVMASLIILSVWHWFPFVLISVTARLQTIPPDLYDAAAIDGANAWQKFLHVTLPQIRGVLAVVILLRSIWMFTKFDVVWLWAGEYGGLIEFVRTLPVYTYIVAFNYYQVGKGAAIADLMFLMLLVSVTLYVKWFAEEEQV